MASSSFAMASATGVANMSGDRPIEFTARGIFRGRGIDGHRGVGLAGAEGPGRRWRNCRRCGRRSHRAPLTGAPRRGSLPSLASSNPPISTPTVLPARSSAGSAYAFSGLPEGTEMLIACDFVGDHLHHRGAFRRPEDAGVDDVPTAGLQAGDHRRKLDADIFGLQAKPLGDFVAPSVMRMPLQIARRESTNCIGGKVGFVDMTSVPGLDQRGIRHGRFAVLRVTQPWSRPSV